jgi:NAD+ synthetase
MEKDYSEIYSEIKNQCVDYIVKNHIQSIIVGVSGGIDSALNAVIMHYICKDERVRIPLIGRYIEIESNKQEEKERAVAIGSRFCDDFKRDDLTELYQSSLKCFGDRTSFPTFEDKIRRGNIKARLRMIYLRDLAQKNHGLLLDNDNKTENELGFWTLDGDVGDFVPLEQLWKTEVFKLAIYIKDNILTDEKDKYALNRCIDAVPTDGLGITSSDVEQLGAKSYDEVDKILKTLIPLEIKYNNNEFDLTSYKEEFDRKTDNLEKIHKIPKEVVDKVWNRHLNSQFKRTGKFIVQL